ncbi:preprotein translocase subunit SecG [Mycoplasmopsis opalescens]|uniref:preprotein translocase subunit SecG n=1 Tax=Mycoplasmopsis opalescens TaxID=114886 RepID=UPI0004A6B8E6|nr:preprotein translocase subunit SecG [Mycoplasmopsis opalescens]
MAVLVITIIMVVIALCVIIASLLMSPDSNAFSGALVGSGDLELFKYSKERGFKKFLKWFMFTIGILLMIGALIIRILM